MGGLIRSMDWSRTPLGPIEIWPQSLRTTVGLCLASNFPIALAWGPDRVQIYNDGYWPICAEKHPRSMGQDFKECWFSAWPAIGDAFERASAGETAFLVNQRMFLDRKGYLEETFFTFSFSPIRDETGRVTGLFHPVTELTQQSLAERRLKALRDVADRTGNMRSVDDACTVMARTLAAYDLDLPFVLFYRYDEQGTRAVLAASVGTERSEGAAPRTIGLDGAENGSWPLGRAMRAGPVLVTGLRTRIPGLVAGPYPETPPGAFVAPINVPGLKHPLGFLVAGVSARRDLDDPYRTFFTLLTDGVTNAMAAARAYQEERRRAESLAELDRAKTAFFSNVSHEFRTPLTLMLGPLDDVLARGGEKTAEQEQLTVVRRNAQRLLKLVNSLLDFSRIEAGRVEAVYQPVDLTAVTADLASTFRSAIERAGMELRVDCAGLPGGTWVDRDMWEKIVLNLLSNAFKYTFEGSITVTLRAADGAAVLSVRDTGTGIPPAEQSRIFERFHRIEGARGRTHEGTGIGLALVQELVRLHGGSVDVESEVGTGSTFSVRIPFGTAHLPAERIQGRRALASTALGASPFVEEALRWLPDEPPSAYPQPVSPADRGGLPADVTGARVLLVDDNADMRDYLRRLLGEAGYDVTAAPEGRAALELALRDPPALVLADVMMPGLDGFGLIRELRANQRTREIPVILLSARAGEDSRIEGLRRGASDYLVKPFAARELLARVGGALARRSERQSTEAHLREETRILETLNRVGKVVSAELDLEKVVQTITDVATELAGAAFGAFFHNTANEQGESFRLYTLSGAPREAFSTFPVPRKTAIFGPTFTGDGPVRSADITRDARYGKNPPFHGMPPGHLEVRSYLAVPVRSRSGKMIGGLFFGHPEAGVFDERAERLMVGIASQAAIAIDNASMYREAQREISERRRVEMALGESEERFARFMYNLPGLAWIKDAEGRYVFVNGAAVTPFGRARDAILGRTDEELFAPESARQFRENDRRALAAADGIQVVESLMRPDGLRHSLVSKFRIPGTQGAPDLLGGVAIDITQQKEAETRLKASERLYRAIGESNDYGVWVCAPDGRNIYASESFLRMTGLTQEECSNFGWGSVLHPEDAGRTMAAWKECVATGSAWSIEHRFRGVDGQWHPVLARGVPVRDEDGQIIAWAGINLDIRQLREAEGDLRESETRFRELADSVPVLIWMNDLEGCEFVNREYLRFIGRPMEDTQGMKWKAFVHPDDVDECLALYRRAFERVERYDALFRFRRADGEYRWIRSVGVPRLSPDGRFCGFVGCSTDITEIKQSAEALKESDRRKDEFLATLAHELRNPLAPISNGLEVVKLSRDEESVTQARAMMERQLRHLVRLVDDLLDVSRISRGKIELRTERVDIAAVLRSATETSRPLIEDAGHELVAHLPSHPVWINVDVTRMAQVFSNLLNNAAKYTPPRGRIELSAGQNGGTVTVRVRDNGIGIPANMLGSVFELFAQVDRSLERTLGGLGIGLTIVKRLVEMHGGTVEARSEGRGRGAEFEIRLPAALRVSGPQGAMDDSQTPEPRESRRVLVVDDNRDAATTLAMVLQVMGHDTRTAYDGLEAIAIAEAYRPDIILLDIGMPKMNGYDTCRRIREQPWGQQVVVVALTGWGQAEDQRKSKEAGFNHHLVKPVHPPALQQILSGLRTGE